MAAPGTVTSPRDHPVPLLDEGGNPCVRDGGFHHTPPQRSLTLSPHPALLASLPRHQRAGRQGQAGRPGGQLLQPPASPQRGARLGLPPRPQTQPHLASLPRPVPRNPYRAPVFLKAHLAPWATVNGRHYKRCMKSLPVAGHRQAGHPGKPRPIPPPSQKAGPATPPSSGRRNALGPALAAGGRGRGTGGAAAGTDLKREEALHGVGPVQAVETVHPQSAFLKT